jgi:hypothetical protein
MASVRRQCEKKMEKIKVQIKYSIFFLMSRGHCLGFEGFEVIFRSAHKKFYNFEYDY